MEIQLFGETARVTHRSCHLENIYNFPHKSDSLFILFLMGNHLQKYLFCSPNLIQFSPPPKKTPPNNKRLQQNGANEQHFFGKQILAKAPNYLIGNSSLERQSRWKKTPTTHPANLLSESFVSICWNFRSKGSQEGQFCGKIKKEAASGWALRNTLQFAQTTEFQNYQIFVSNQLWTMCRSQLISHVISLHLKQEISLWKGWSISASLGKRTSNKISLAALCL